MMKTGPAGVAWFPLSEMGFDLAFNSLSKLRPYVDELVEQGWIVREQSKGNEYYIVPDPTTVIATIRAKRTDIPADRLEALDEIAYLLAPDRGFLMLMRLLPTVIVAGRSAHAVQLPGHG